MTSIEPEKVLLDRLNTNSLSFLPLKDNKSGMGKSANVSYNNGRFRVVMTNVRFPFGVSAKKPEYRVGDKDQWSLQCELNEQQIQVLKDIDNKAIDLAMGSESFMKHFTNNGRKPSREVLEDKYFRTLKYSRDKDGNPSKYPPTMRLTVPSDKTDGFSTGFFISTPQGTQPIKVDNVPGSDNNIANHIPNNSSGSLMFSMSVWATQTGFGVTLRLEQIKLNPSQTVDRSVCQLDGLDALLQSGEEGHQVQDPELEEVEKEKDDEVEEVEEQLEDGEESEVSRSPTPPPPAPKAKVTRKPATKK